jgi:hypothetical protein
VVEKNQLFLNKTICSALKSLKFSAKILSTLISILIKENLFIFQRSRIPDNNLKIENWNFRKDSLDSFWKKMKNKSDI